MFYFKILNFRFWHRWPKQLRAKAKRTNARRKRKPGSGWANYIILNSSGLISKWTVSFRPVFDKVRLNLSFYFMKLIDRIKSQMFFFNSRAERKQSVSILKKNQVAIIHTLGLDLPYQNRLLFKKILTSFKIWTFWRQSGHIRLKIHHFHTRVRHVKIVSPCDQLSQNLHTPKLFSYELRTSKINFN